jgi:hypothetical protein
MLAWCLSAISPSFWLAPALVVLALLVVRAVRGVRQNQSRHLPKAFDFDTYKSREITARGVFDKTKWH